MAYAFMAMLNNAIDHSESQVAIISLWINSDQWCFEIKDFGVGAYAKLKDGLHLGSEFEAVQELSKGKRTTDPTQHTGEGIFLRPRRWIYSGSRRLECAGQWITSGATKRWAPSQQQRVRRFRARSTPEAIGVLADIFREFTQGNAFVRTRPVVKLFEIGTAFVSRSEARRLLAGPAADFDTIEVDFAGVTDVGQGFVDELLRVWQLLTLARR